MAEPVRSIFPRPTHTGGEEGLVRVDVHDGRRAVMVLRLELTAGTPSWRRFRQLVNQRFGPPITDTPLGALAHLRHTGTINDYCDQFLALACRDVELTESQQVQLFIAGLVN